MRLRYASALALLLPALARAQETPALFAAPQAYSIYALFDGIEGESAERDHARWIDVAAYSHALSSPGAVGTGGGAGAGKVQHEPVVFVKNLDASSPELIKALNTGKNISKATFDFVRAGERKFVFLRVVLDDVRLIAYSVSGSAGADALTESISVVYRKITWTYTPQKPDGSAGTPVTTSYDASTNTASAVALSSFESFSERDAVVFRWRTLSESADYGFELQRWQDGAFQRAAYVPGAGWSQTPLEYEVRIRGLDKGIHTFRLALLGVDGSVAYSDDVTVAFGVPEGRDVVVEAPYPNPFRGAAHVAVAVARVMDARVVLCDLLGREVATLFEGVLEPGGARHFTLQPDARLAAGPYALRVETPAGVETRLVTLLR